MPADSYRLISHLASCLGNLWRNARSQIVATHCQLAYIQLRSARALRASNWLFPALNPLHTSTPPPSPTHSSLALSPLAFGPTTAGVHFRRLCQLPGHLRTCQAGRAQPHTLQHTHTHTTTHTYTRVHALLQILLRTHTHVTSTRDDSCCRHTTKVSFLALCLCIPCAA